MLGYFGERDYSFLKLVNRIEWYYFVNNIYIMRGIHFDGMLLFHYVILYNLKLNETRDIVHQKYHIIR